MVQFGELCAWKMPGVAKTQMRDVGKIGAERWRVCRAGDSSKQSHAEGTLGHGTV